MGKSSLKEKRERQDRLLSLLKENSFWTTAELSEELSTSLRTLMRDIQELREIGHPIEADRGRGGGISLKGRFGLTKLYLNNEEVISTLISLAVTEALHSPILGENLKSIRQKISMSFPSDQQTLIRSLRKRIYVGSPSSKEILKGYNKPSPAIAQKLKQAFFSQTKIEIHYIDEKMNKTQRIIEPQMLLLNWPIWYFLCWDELREDFRLFRIDRIKKVSPLSKSFQLRSKSLMLKGFEEYFERL